MLQNLHKNAIIQFATSIYHQFFSPKTITKFLPDDIKFLWATCIFSPKANWIISYKLHLQQILPQLQDVHALNPYISYIIILSWLFICKFLMHVSLSLNVTDGSAGVVWKKFKMIWAQRNRAHTHICTRNCTMLTLVHTNFLLNCPWYLHFNPVIEMGNTR